MNQGNQNRLARFKNTARFVHINHDTPDRPVSRGTKPSFFTRSMSFDMEIVIRSFGAKLRIRNGMYCITVPDLGGGKGALTEECIPVHEVKSILLEKGTSVSSDALMYAMQNDTDLLLLDHFGHPVGRLLPTRPSSILTIWQHQLFARQSVYGLAFARDWIVKKMDFQSRFLEKLKPYRRQPEKIRLLDSALAILAASREKLRNLPDLPPLDQPPPPEKPEAPPPSFRSDLGNRIRIIEAHAQKIYWNTLSALLPATFQFDGRSRRPAADAFNLFLNYAYGILYRHIESALLRAGLHPHLGFLHADGYQRKSLVFDFIEPFRIWADQLVFHLFSEKSVNQTHVAALPDGGLSLTPSGKTFLATAFADRLRQRKYPYARDGTLQFLDRLMLLESQNLVSGLALLFAPLLSAFSEN